MKKAQPIDRQHELWRLSVYLVLLTAGWGWWAAGRLKGSPLTRSGPRCFNAFYWLFSSNEPVFFILLILFSALALRPAALNRDFKLPSSRRFDVAAIGVLAGVALVIGRLGAHFVFHDYGLSMDEYASGFQARIFAEGHLRASIPPAWHQISRALTPVFILRDPVRSTWIAGFLPVYSALRSLFSLLKIEAWLNPAAALGSILLIGGISLRLWPDSRRRAVLAAGLLLLSCQFLVMSMTQYSYPAHLFFNLAWLYLSLRPEPWAWRLLPWLSLLALGLHNPVPHALFVAPFLLRMAFSRDRSRLAYIAPILLLGSVFWWKWLAMTSATGSAGGRLQIFQIPGGSAVILQSLNLGLILSWQTPVAGLLVVFAILSWKRLDVTMRCLAAGALLTYGFYWLYPENQQHGWGYRYTYSVLGNGVLLAVAGLGLISEERFRNGVRNLVMISASVTALVQFPLRCLEAEKFVHPFAAGSLSLASRKGKIVVIDNDASWYAQDYVRNDPFLRNDPLFLNLDFLPPQNRTRLSETFGSRVEWLTRGALAAAKGEPDTERSSPCSAAPPTLAQIFTSPSVSFR